MYANLKIISPTSSIYLGSLQISPSFHCQLIQRTILHCLHFLPPTGSSAHWLLLHLSAENIPAIIANDLELLNPIDIFLALPYLTSCNTWHCHSYYLSMELKKKKKKPIFLPPGFTASSWSSTYRSSGSFFLMSFSSAAASQMFHLALSSILIAPKH